jgi:DNA-binding HxlR family transcriptional regulator
MGSPFTEIASLPQVHAASRTQPSEIKRSKIALHIAAWDAWGVRPRWIGHAAATTHRSVSDYRTVRELDMADECGFADAIKVIGGKWKADILWELHLAPRRFGRLRVVLPGISDKILMQALREMELDGIVHRQSYPGSPPKVVYTLTDRGASLNQGVIARSDWGVAHRRAMAGVA